MKDHKKISSLFRRSAAILLTALTAFSPLKARAAENEQENLLYKITLKNALTFPTPLSDVILAEDKRNIKGISDAKTAEIRDRLVTVSQSAFDAFISDHPTETMWMDPPDSAYSIGIHGTFTPQGELYAVDVTVGDLTYLLKQNSSYTDPKGMYDFLVSEAKKFKPEGSTLYEKVKSIHDYICFINKYDKTAPHSHSAYGALIDHKSVCEGYAEAFKLICDVNGIPCIIVSGKTTEAHMWNYVKMDDGKWYALDATWDDDDKTGKIKTKYLLVGSKNSAYSKDHKANGDISGSDLKVFDYPTLSKTDYKPTSGTSSTEDVSGYYYNQLDEAGKNVYDELMKFALPEGKVPVVTTTAKLPQTTPAVTTSAPATSSAATTAAGTTPAPATSAAVTTAAVTTAGTVTDEPAGTETGTDTDADTSGTDAEPTSTQSVSESEEKKETTVTAVITVISGDGTLPENDTEAGSSDTEPDTGRIGDTEKTEDGDGNRLPVVIGIAAGGAALAAVLTVIIVKFSKSEKKQ